ncbi:MAG: hypothetical protein WEA56_12015 [Balneolaceae bacterium]
MKVFLYILFIVCCFWPVQVSAQFINIQIDVEPEVETIVEQSLDFGQVISGSGLQQIAPGDASMGIFKLNALRTQKLLVSLEPDEVLTHANPAVTASIPINLQAAYTNNGISDVRNSVPLNSLYENIIVEGPPANPRSTWSAVHIYIYGSIDIGNTPAGIYRGQVVLTVIYE